MNKNLVLSVLISALFFGLFSYRIVSSYNFDNDFARDLVDVTEITHGHIRLIGPGASFGGLKTSPYYYYFLAPAIYISHYSIPAVLYWNALFFALALGFFCNSFSKKYSLLHAMIMTCLIGISPLYIQTSRHPGNGYSYISLLLILFSILLTHDFQKKYMLLLTGFLMGVVATTHYSNVLTILIVVVYVFVTIKKKSLLVWFVAGIGGALLPLVFFELKHDFIMMRNTFGVQSYKAFINNELLPGVEKPPQNIVLNIFFISHKINTIINIHPILVGALVFIAIRFTTKNIENRLLGWMLLIIFVSTVIVVRYQFATHYLYPTAFVTLLLFVVLMTRTKNIAVLAGALLWMCIQFPRYEYSQSTRPYKQFENIINSVIAKNIITKKNSFNVLQERPDTIIVPHGYEYRFFLIKKGYIPKSITEYNASQQLLVFSTIPPSSSARTKISNWETREYGQANMKNLKIAILGDISVYTVTK